jgi:DNA-binding protein H-NS
MARSPVRNKDMSEIETPLPPEPEVTTERGGFRGMDLDNMPGEELVILVEAALDRMDLEDLVSVIEAAESRRNAKQEQAKETLLAEFKERAGKMGISLETLFPRLPEQTTRRSRKDAGRPLAVKFRGPLGETWSGRGIPPRWMSALEATGHNREEFRIKEAQDALVLGDPA